MKSYGDGLLEILGISGMLFGTKQASSEPKETIRFDREGRRLLIAGIKI